MITQRNNILLQLIEDCSNEPDIDKKIEILYHINSLLPKPYQLKVPSFLTDDYIDRALYKIEEKIMMNHIN